MTLEGHTDNTGPEAYDPALSEQRAGMVRDYAVSQGVADRRVVIRATR